MLARVVIPISLLKDEMLLLLMSPSLVYLKALNKVQEHLHQRKRKMRHARFDVMQRPHKTSLQPFQMESMLEIVTDLGNGKPDSTGSGC